MTYRESVEFLGGARRFGLKFGLEPMEKITRALVSPQDQLRFIHIAGTNGKGSTAAFSESCLRAAGYRVGLYTSPHLINVRERIQMNRHPISEEEFAGGMTLVREVMEKTLEAPATFFETLTALALWHFARERVDWVVWETGMGGRLDATNVVRPEVCVITQIGLDHQQYLGGTLEEIAGEKAGIIKAGVPVVTSAESEARAVIVRRARREGCAVTIVPDDLPARDLGFCGEVQRALIDGVEYDLGLRGAHQVQNATCAVAALRALNLASDEALASGLKNTAWPARFEVVSHEPITVVDGAHNPDGAGRLAETWKSFLTSIQPATSALSTHLVFGAVADKDPADVARILAPLAAKVSLVRLQNERSCDPRDLVPLFPRANVKTYDSVADWWQQRHPAPGGPVLIAGSLFLAGEVLALREGKTEDCDLNERLGKTLTR